MRPASRVLLIAWIVTLLGALPLELRLTWERTVLTWTQGPQAVGFTLAHQQLPLLLIGTLCMMAALVLLVGLVGATLVALIRRQPVARRRWLQMGSLALLLGLEMVPWDFLQTCFASPASLSADQLVVAAAEGQVSTMAMAARRGAALDRCGSYNSPLGAAAVGGSLPVARLLVEHGVDVNRRCGLLQRTPLMNAAESGKLDVVRYLVEHGADRVLADSSGETAFAIARGARHDEVARALDPFVLQSR
jgi:hypothetical protein